jgi:eukaryotic-like serine/threonine-protein kinase
MFRAMAASGEPEGSASSLRDQLQATLGGAYTLERELGGGGMSRVFAATETALGRQVVVKVLPPELAEGVSVERFKREIALAARLQHPHIVPVHAAGEISGLPYYTMPLVDGHSLRVRLAKGGPLPITEAIGILRDVAKALAYAHERGVVHRDIKPDNVLLSGGSAVVTDFGVAKALSASKALLPSGTLTQVGSSLGTPAYMAPEQAAADPTTDHRADIYAFGIVAYEVLAGRPPFHGRTPQKLLAAQMGERPDPIGELRPDTPPLLAQLVMKCLEKEPSDRPQSAGDIVRVLETVTSGGGLPAMPAILLGGRRRLTRALGLYALAVAVVALVARAAIIVVGLPDWVFPGALAVMALGLPVILFTAFVHHGAYQAMTMGALTPGGSPAMQSTMTKLAVKASPWVSWRRTTLGGVAAVSAFAVLVLGFMVSRALGIGPAGSLLAAGKLKGRERILVTDFRATGADTSLGNVVTEALRTDLGQSSVISVVPPSVVSEALGRMRRPETSRVDLPLARQIAAREGIKAVVDGDVQPLAGGYLVTVRLVGADAGDELASYHATIDSPKELIPALDKLARDLRAKIGESLKAVRANPPLEQVTTPSLDALRKYAEGVRANDIEGDYPKAIELLKAAVALDTTFAMGYRKLGVALNNDARPTEQVNAALTRAYRFRDHLTERERYLAIATYFDFGPGLDRAQAAAAYETLLARDSLDPVAVTNLGALESRRRNFARSETLSQRALNSSGGANSFLSLDGVQIDLGQLDAADSTLARMRRAIPTSPLITFGEWSNLYARGRLDSVTARLTHVHLTEENSGVRALSTRGLGDIEAMRGRLAEASRLYADATAQDVARGATPPPLDAAVVDAALDIWFRELPARGLRTLDTALTRHPLVSLSEYQRPYLTIAPLYALAGRPDRARAILTQYATEMKDSALVRAQDPDRHNALAEIALAEHKPLDAITEFKLADRLPDGPANDCDQCLPARLGRAYDAANMPDSVIASYERYLATPNVFKLTTDRQYLAGIHKRLGELYEAKGDRPKAAGHYLQFVELWKNADPELQPKVAEVRQRLARLRDVEAH